MKFIEAVKMVNSFEKNYEVMSVKMGGVSIWPFLRVYLVDAYSIKTENKATSSNVSLVLKTLFSYNPFCIFKRHTTWVFNSCITRKLVGSLYVHHVSGAITEVDPNLLMFEHPQNGIGHYPKNKIPEKNIVSNSWYLLIVHLIEKILRIKNVVIINEHVIDKILEENDLSFDYHYYARLMMAQKIAMDILLRISNTPKRIFIECPYTQMGLVWAFHKKNIPVIELQHGVINKFHPGYNSSFNSGILAPDEICVYGDEEVRLFKEENSSYCKKVNETGLYILECSDNFFKNDIFSEYRKKYESIIVIAGQKGQEKMLSEFIDRVASLLTNVFFIYIPRLYENDLVFKNENAICKFGVNIYEYLKWCDVHCTIVSTTCIEAHYFKKPTIFYSRGTSAVKYYGDILKQVNGGFYINDEEEFVKAYNTIKSSEFTFKELFAHNTIKAFKEMIDH